MEKKEETSIAKIIDIHLVNGRIIKNIAIESIQLLENPSKDPERKLISKVRLTLVENYMKENYESLSKNFVNIKPKSNMLYIFYN